VIAASGKLAVLVALLDAIHAVGSPATSDGGEDVSRVDCDVNHVLPESDSAAFDQLRNEMSDTTKSSHEDLQKEASNKTKKKPTNGVVEKTVVVSNYTSTLNLVERVISSRKWQSLRIDGSTPPEQRQPLVDRLNRAGDPATVFLLSSHAGGVGLNLIGASRLILFDRFLFY